MDFYPHLNHTSGSTGEPLNYYIDRQLAITINACVQRHYRWCGVESDELIAVFRGTLIDEFGKEGHNYWKLIGNQLHFSTFEMTDEVMAEYIKQVNKWKPALIRGYPSSIEILAKFISYQNVRIHSPKAIHTSSEMVSQEQREVIEKAFNAKLFDWYGHGESAVNAGECDKHEGLHLGMEFGYTEFIKTPETENMDNTYNIISTSLHNYSMPFIRYDTEDLALLGQDKCSCGRSLPLISKIVGRQADIIEGINGVKISPSSLVHFWKYKVADDLSDIIFTQIIQKSKSLIQVKLVGQKTDKNEKLIKEKLKSVLGDMQIEFHYLPKIPTGQKWRFTIRDISA
jgi:phenylacetate-CoA ligase